MREGLGSGNGVLGFLSVALGLLFRGESLAQAPVKLPPENKAIGWLAFSPDGKLLASITVDVKDGIKLWDVPKAKLVRTLTGHDLRNGPFVVTPDGKSLVSLGLKRDPKALKIAHLREAKVWDVSTGDARLTFQIRTTGHLAVTPDGKTLIISGTNDFEGNIEAATLYDLSTGKEVAVLKQAIGKQSCMALSLDGKLLATGRTDGTVTLWDVAARKQLFVFSHTPFIAAVGFSPDGKTLAVGGSLGLLVLWDLTTGKDNGKMNVGQELRSIHCLAFSPEGRRLVLAGNGLVPALLWDVDRWTPEREFKPDKQTKLVRVPCMALSPDGTTLATGDTDTRTITLWKLPPPKPEK